MEPIYTMIWPVAGVCDMYCPFYVEGSLEKEETEELKIGEHCRFNVQKRVAPNCDATERNPEADK